MKKRLMAGLLAAVMLLTLLSGGALALDWDDRERLGRPTGRSYVDWWPVYWGFDKNSPVEDPSLVTVTAGSADVAYAASKKTAQEALDDNTTANAGQAIKGKFIIRVKEGYYLSSYRLVCGNHKDCGITKYNDRVEVEPDENGDYSAEIRYAVTGKDFSHNQLRSSYPTEKPQDAWGNAGDGLNQYYPYYLLVEVMADPATYQIAYDWGALADKLSSYDVPSEQTGLKHNQEVTTREPAGDAVSAALSAGYVFDGWEIAGTGYADGASIDAGGKVVIRGSDLTLTAKWSAAGEPDVSDVRVVVSCTNASAGHAGSAEQVLQDGDYTSASRVADRHLECTVTVKSDRFVHAYDTNTGETHTPASVTRTITYVYDSGWRLKSGSSKTVTFEVACDPIPTYSLTYDANGGTGAPAKAEGLTAQTSYTLSTQKPVHAADADRKKVVFIGWTVEKDTKIYSKDDTTPVTVTAIDIAGDTTVYAVWGYDTNENGTADVLEDKYTIVYDLNAGAGNSVTGAAPTDTASYLAGAAVTLKDGSGFASTTHDFHGWALASDADTALASYTVAAGDANADKVITLYAVWTEKPCTLTYDANGGAWESDVAGYTMNTGRTTAAQTMAKGTVIAQIGTSPVRAGKQLTGWYDDAACTEPVVFTPAARLYHDLTLYAGWKDIPADYVTYTIRQHYIGADGEEDRAVNISNLSAEKGTALLALYQHLRQNVTFPDTGLTYLFMADDTKITPAPVDGKLTDPTTIDLYYALDAWKDGAQMNDRDEPDSLTGGDGVPDYQQAVIQFTSDPNGTLSGPTVQVFTLTAQDDAAGRYLDEITSETVTPEPKTDFTFVCWTKGAEEGAVTPFEPQTLYGGDEITYTAHFTGVQKTAYFTVAHYLVDATAPFAVNDRDYRELGTVLAAGDFAKQPFVTVEDRHYAYDHADPYTLTVGADEAQNVLKLYYAPDEIGGGADLDQPDGVPDQYQVTIRYRSETGGTITGTVKEVVTLKDPNGGWTVTGDASARGSQVERSSSRYRFDGWTKDWTNETDGFASGEETLAPFTIRNATGGKTYTVTAEFYKRSSSGSSDSSKDDDKTPDLEKGDHYAYIVGYAEDGTVRPNANITRAEVAAIFFRLLTDDARDAYWCTSNRFPDVTPDAWYNNAVSTVANAGILVGNPDGTFRPNANITRAEFAAIAARFLSDPSEGRDRFTDTANHWARALINQAAAEKWVTGYKDGTFRPDNAITRAEAVTLINNVLERGPDADHMLKKMVTWPDNADRSAWYYEAIQEATNSHDYTWREDDDSEKWTKLLETRDWPALEREWSSKHAGKGEIDIDDGPSI